MDDKKIKIIFDKSFDKESRFDNEIFSGYITTGK